MGGVLNRGATGSAALAGGPPAPRQPGRLRMSFFFACHEPLGYSVLGFRRVRTDSLLLAANIMIIEERGLIFDAIHRPAQERVNAFTSLCRLRSGTILAGFQSGPAKHATSSTIRICRSENDGRTWHDMGMPFDSPLEGVPGSLATGDMAEVAPGRLVLFSTWFDRSDPDRPLFDPVTQGILHSKQVWAESADEGASWGEWRVLPTPGLTGCAATGPVLQWPDGTMAFAFES